MAGPLSLPEAMVILLGARTDPNEIVFVALLELVVRGGARLVRVQVADADECAIALQDRDRVIAPPLAALFEMLVDAMERSPRVGCATAKYVQRAFEIRWATADSYVRREVWASLVERDLLLTRKVGFDAFAPDTWRLTEAGNAERDRLRLALASEHDWRRQPGTALLRVHGLAVPSEATFDAIDEFEDLMTRTSMPLGHWSYRTE